MAKRKNNKNKKTVSNPAKDVAILSSRQQWGPIAALAFGFLLFGYRMFDLISEYSVNILYWDQWDFDNATLFQRHTLWQMFSWQHGPHRQGLGALLQWLAEPLFHWNSRTESFLVGGVILVAALLAVWLKKRLYGEISYSDVIIPLIFLSPLQFETLFVTANFAHGPLPLLLVVLYCLAWTNQNLTLRYGLVLMINFLAIYTGFGIFLGLLTPVLFALDYWVTLRNTQTGRTYFSVALLTSVVSLSSFFIGYKSQPAADCFNPKLQVTADYFWYVALMFAPFFGEQGISALPRCAGVGAVSALFACLWISLRNPPARNARWESHRTIATLISYCFLFCIATAYGRLCLGVQSALNSRYAIYLNLGLLGLYFSLLLVPRNLLRHTLVSIFGLSLLGTIASGERSRGVMEMVRSDKQEWKDCYIKTGDVEKCNQSSRVYPGDPAATHLTEKLEFLRKNRQNLFADSE